MSEPILKVENMNKKFGSTVALNDVSLNMYDYSYEKGEASVHTDMQNK